MLKRIGLVLISVLILTLLFPTSALAEPQRPHQFYGTVNVGDGVLVEAKINGTTYGTCTTHGGTYGLNYDSVSNLMQVAADDPDTTDIIEGGVNRDTVKFYVGTIKAEEEYTFEIGGYTELPLTILGPLPEPLIAEAGGPYSGTEGAGIALSGSASDGTPPYTFAWDLDYDGTYETTGATPSHSWDTAGTYTIGLRVTDNASDTDTDTATVRVTAPAPPSEAGGAPPTYYTETNIFGTEARFRIDSDGEILKTIEATSEDGMLTMTIPRGTIALDKDGDRLDSLEVSVDESPPTPPEDAHVIGLAYEFGPEGATFDPPLTLIWSYDPDALPEGVAEEDLVLAYYDEDTEKWVELDCVVDTKNKTITASAEHFTTFAIIGTVTPAAFILSSLGISPAEVNIGEPIAISLLVTNTGGKSGSYTVTLKINGGKEAEKAVTIGAGESQDVSFTVTKEDAGSYSVAVDGLSGSFTVVVPAAFLVSSLSIEPAEVEPKEPVTITMSVANTGDMEGSYSIVLKINRVKEADKSVTIGAGESHDVSFTVTKEDAGSYSVAVDGLSGSFTVVAPPAFLVSSLSIEPAEAQPKEPVTITMSVANTGGMEGSYSIVLKINGVKEAEKAVTIGAGESQDVSFTVTKEDAGSYSIAVDGLSGSFTVVAPPVVAPPAAAAFSVSSLSIQPAEVQLKEPVTITMSVANTGGMEGSYSIVLKINGVKEAEKAVTIGAGGSQDVSFTVTREAAGSYSVVVDELSGSFTVVAPAPTPINWPLVGGIIAGVIVVGLLIFFLAVRRRAY